jgi:hypothetical protein
MNPLIRTYYWLSHYLFSNTLHGTHSPFVYSFLENVVYQKSTPSQKKLGLLTRIAKFTPNNLILCINADESSLAALSTLNKNISTNYEDVKNEALGFVYFGEGMHAAEMMDLYHQLKLNTNSESVFVFSNLLESSTKTKVWRHLCKDATNIISIDFLHTGILFFDKKKPKEHFRIYY